jgi:hypothetical protein
MKTFYGWFVALFTVVAFSPLFAQAGDQQNRMKVCAKQYHEQNIAKDQYHAFMSKCLKKDSSMAATPSKPATAPVTAKPDQKNKMKECNASAATQNLKGAARKDFMKTCLSGPVAPVK